MARTVAGMKRQRVTTTVVSKRQKTSSEKPKGCHAQFRRTTLVQTVVFDPASRPSYYNVLNPTLANLPDVTQFTEMFDTYKITNCKITLIPKYGDSGYNATGVPQMILAIGKDTLGSELPSGPYNATTWNTFAERCENVKFYTFNKPISYSFKPNIRNAATVGSTLIKCPWISTTTSTQPMLGSEVFVYDTGFQATLSSVQFSYDVYYTLTFQCKGQR